MNDLEKLPSKKNNQKRKKEESYIHVFYEAKQPPLCTLISAYIMSWGIRFLQIFLAMCPSRLWRGELEIQVYQTTTI